MSDLFPDPEEVQEDLNIIEQTASYASAEDEYMAALLRGQKLLAQGLLGMGAFDNPTGLNPNNLDRDNLPEGLTGTAVGEIENGDFGSAIFDVNGSSIEARVKAGATIEAKETVVIIDDNNLVRPSANIQEAVNVRVSGNQGATNTEYVSTESPIPVESTDETSIEFGFEADSITIFGFNAPIYVAFSPQEEKSRLIPLSPEDDPFSVPFSAEKMWYRKPSEGTSNTQIKVLAMK